TPQSSVSNNGRYIVYESTSINLVPNQSQPPNAVNVFLYDSQGNNGAGSTVLISHAAGDPATAANGTSFNAVISGDGTTVAFYSTAPNLVSSVTIPAASVQLYLYNTAKGNITLVSTEFGLTTTGSNGQTPVIPPSPSSHWLNTLGYNEVQSTGTTDLIG